MFGFKRGLGVKKVEVKEESKEEETKEAVEEKREKQGVEFIR